MNEEEKNTPAAAPASASAQGGEESFEARMERLVGGSDAGAPTGYRRRTFKGSGTGKSEDRAVNRQLSARRELMEKRVKRGRITLWVFAALSLAEIVLQLFTTIRLPLSCTISDLLTVYGLFSIPCLIAAFLPIVYMVALAIGFRKDSFEAARKCLTVFLWVDFIFTLALGGRAYGLENRYLTWEMGANLILHVPVIWFMMRAVRAVDALEILPTQEMEGDPYAGFGSNADLPDENEEKGTNDNE